MLELIEKKLENVYFAQYKGELFALALFDYKKLSNSKREYGIDSYYLQSNDTYHQISNVVKELNELGFIAQVRTDVAYKSLALAMKVGYIGRHQLLITKKGTRVLLGVFSVKIDERLSKEIIKRDIMQLDSISSAVQTKAPFTYNSKCNNCKLCVKACPTGAIQEHSFDPTKCKRYLQENIKTIPIEDIKHIGNSLLGCDICTDVCPQSKKSELFIDNACEVFPNSLEELINIIVAGKEQRKCIAEHIGYNYDRPTWLLSLALAVYINCKYTFELPIEKLKSYNSSRIEELLKVIEKT